MLDINRDASFKSQQLPKLEADRTSGALAALLAPVRRALVIACLIQAIASIVGLVPYVAIAKLGAELLVADPDNSRVWTIAAIAGVTMAASIALTLGALSITHIADSEFQLTTRRRLAAHLGSLPLGWFDDKEAGQINKALTEDVAAIHPIVGHTFTDITAALVAAFGALGYLFWVDWRMALIILIPFSAGVALYAKQMSGYGEKLAIYDASIEAVNAAGVEFVQGISVVKTFGETRRAHTRYAEATESMLTTFWNWISGMFNTASLADLVLSPLATLTLVSGTGVWFVETGRMPVADLLLFMVLGLALTKPVLSLGYASNQITVAVAAARRVAALLRIPTMQEPTTPETPTSNLVELDAVSFAYADDEIVLHDINLDFVPGTVTALVGPSGSGKSTLGKLLCRFWDPTEGAVRLGGVDLRAISATERSSHVGFVFQDVQLIRASVHDNIALARPTATTDEVHAAAVAAQIHDRVMTLPRGYDSEIGVDAQLSGGERQRLSIARVLLANPPVLVLDEATAFADPDSEAEIQRALSNLSADRTLIVIAHRLSTIMHADNIVVLDEGRIVEQGRHHDLVDANQTYARLWQADSRIEVKL